MISINNNLQVFNNQQFGQVRMVEIENKPYFVATDIANALGYSNPHDAIKRHCRWVVKHEVPHPQSKYKTLDINVIPEGDMYRLITNSNLPNAEKFEMWVFDEVLPSIRKTGSYNSNGITKAEILAIIKDLPNDRLKNELSMQLMSLLPVDNKQIPASKFTYEQIETILNEFLTKCTDAILKQTQYGLAVNKTKLYKHFEKHGIKWTETLRLLDEYGFIYHKEGCRTIQTRVDNVNGPVRVVIIKE